MKDAISVSSQDADYIKDRMEAEPNETYSVVQFFPKEKKLEINVGGKNISAGVPYNASQIHSLSRSRYVHVQFKRLGDAIGLIVTTC